MICLCSRNDKGWEADFLVYINLFCLSALQQDVELKNTAAATLQSLVRTQASKFDSEAFSLLISEVIPHLQYVERLLSLKKAYFDLLCAQRIRFAAVPNGPEGHEHYFASAPCRRIRNCFGAGFKSSYCLFQEVCFCWPDSGVSVLLRSPLVQDNTLRALLEFYQVLVTSKGPHANLSYTSLSKALFAQACLPFLL